MSLRCSMRLPPEVEVLLEEKMRQIVREKRAVRVLEMVPVSARGLLLKEGQRMRAEALSEEGLVEIIQIGSYYNLSPGPHLSCTSELPAFKLWPIEDEGNGTFRLSGCACASKEELKLFLKKLRAYAETGHARIGIKEKLWCFSDGQLVWLPEGLRRLEEMIWLLRENLFKGFLEVRMAPETNRLGFMKERGVEGIAEIRYGPSVDWDAEMGLFAGNGGVEACLRMLLPEGDLEKKWISSLQLAEKTLNILGFQHRLRLNGRKQSGKGYQALTRALESLGKKVEVDPGETDSRLEFLVEDQLRRPWPAFSMEIRKSEIFMTASVERLVALLIEKKSRTNETVDEIENQ